MDGGTAYPSFVHSLVGGDLCITDMRTHALHVLTLAGDFKRTIDASGALQFAMGVTSDGDSIFVADGLADCIHRLQLSTGALLATVGGLSYPHGLALAGGTLFCADWGNHRVQTFNSDTLEPLSAIGQMGEGAADLCYPRGVAAAEGSLFVADTENHRVQVFTLCGRHVRSVGPLREPYAVAVAHGRMFVAQMDGRLKILTLEPDAVLQEVELPGGPLSSRLLCGLCADARRVYVAGYVAEERQLHILAARPPATESASSGGDQGSPYLRPPTAGPRAGRRAGRGIGE